MVSSHRPSESAEVIFLHGERYERDPLSAAFPNVSDDELEMLAQNIKANGQEHPILINERTDTVIDGWQRLRACEKLEIEPIVRTEDVPDPARRVMALNVHRRGNEEQTAGQRMLRAIDLWLLDSRRNRKPRKGNTRAWPLESWVMETAGVSRASYSQLKYAVRHDDEFQTSFEAEIRAGRMNQDKASRKARALRKEAEWAAQQHSSQSQDESSVQAKERADSVRTGRPVDDEAEPQAEWKEEIRERLLELTPSGFERFTAAFLEAAGYRDVKVTGRSGDGGIDGTATAPLGSLKIAFQCKRYEGQVSAPAIRDFRGAVDGRFESGLLVTTGAFTREAKREANRRDATRVGLIDCNDLCDSLKERGVGVSVRMVEEVNVDHDYFAQFEDAE